MNAKRPTRTAREELLTALQGVLAKHYGKPRRILRLRRRDSAYSSSSAIENLWLDLDDGERLSLVFKDLSPSALLEAARHVRPHFLYDPAREIEAYRGILALRQVGVPSFYGAVQQQENQRHWLFLERVNGPLLWQVGRIDTWREAAQWLARFHRECGHLRYNVHSRRLTALLRYDRAHLGLWPSRAQRFLDRKRAAHMKYQWRAFDRLAERYDKVIERLLAIPQTLIHGEFYPSNVIVRRETKDRRICAIDWEVSGFGPGLLDLAALTSGDWAADQKRMLIAAYREAVVPARGWPPALPELIESVEYCQLHLAVQWLGWADEWSPPDMHAKNWLREAVRLTENLGI